MMKKKKKLSEEDLINWWLEKFHSTNLNQVVKENPEWDEKNYTEEQWLEVRNGFTNAFYQKYKVTQEQHDEWNKWAIKALAKDFKVSQRYMKKSWWSIYLNTAPSTIEDSQSTE